MFASDIGMNNIEEINIVHEGQNYGWMKREGLFENGIARPGGALNQLFPLAAEVLRAKTTDGFTYPVAMFDHTQGQAVTGGVATRRRHAAPSGQDCVGQHGPGGRMAPDPSALLKDDERHT